MKRELAVTEWNLTATRTNDIQSNVDCRAMQVCRPTQRSIWGPFAADQPQEQSLKHVLCVGSVTRNSKGGPIYHLVIIEKRLFDFGGTICCQSSFNGQDQLLAVSCVSILLTLQAAND
jgi:hypothetical protein